MKKKSISLCMIVKNEANFIAQCLESVLDVVDEMIIVDTGSTDDTIDICKKYGANVFHYKWNNHFADARNFSISKATGEWILILDADESIHDEKKSELIEIVNHTKANKLLLPVKMYYGSQLPINKENFYTYYQPRLFQNFIGYYYQGRIHETLSLQHAKKKVIDEYININIDHYGYIKEVENNKRKSERNLQLLKMDYHLTKSNPWIEYHLASEYYRLQNYPKAFDFVNNSIYSFLVLNIKPPALLYRLKYAILIETDSIEGAWPGIDKATQLYPDYVDLLFYKGYILYKKENYMEAKLVFEQCLMLGEEHPEYLILKGTGSFMPEKYVKKCEEKLTYSEN